MDEFAIELTGLPAFILLLLVVYVFVFLPIKFVTIVIAHARKKAGRIRKLQQNVIIAGYSAPENLSPAEIGFLYDAKLNLAEIFSTIVSLEQKGMIKITEENNRYKITEVAKAKNMLSEFEKHILDLLRDHEGQKVTLRMLNDTWYKAEIIIRKQLQAAGYLLSTKKQLKKWLIRVGVILAALISLTFLFFRPSEPEEIAFFLFFAACITPFYFIVSLFLYGVFTRVTGEPWLGTERLKQIWPDIEGYRYYIQQVELDNLQFDSENTKGLVKNKVLPYAIALGFDTGWRKKVK